jgi:hypothetical protein
MEMIENALRDNDKIINRTIPSEINELGAYSERKEDGKPDCVPRLQENAIEQCDHR